MTMLWLHGETAWQQGCHLLATNVVYLPVADGHEPQKLLRRDTKKLMADTEPRPFLYARMFDFAAGEVYLWNVVVPLEWSVGTGSGGSVQLGRLAT